MEVDGQASPFTHYWLQEITALKALRLKMLETLSKD